MLKISRLWILSVVLCRFVGIISCSDGYSEVTTAANEIEHSRNPATFLSGIYRLDKLDLPSGYGEQSPRLTSQYEVNVRAVGDSVQLTLSGMGKAGHYNSLSLGTFIVTSSASNLTSILVGSNYVYELRPSSGQKSYISFSRIPFSDKTEYSLLFNLYRIRYGLDENKGAIIADESYSINPSYNERIATFRLVRTSPGVWRAN